MRSTTLYRIALAVLIGVSVAGCQDATGPGPSPATQSTTSPALTAATAAHVSIALEDAATRLMPAAGATPLGTALRNLTSVLTTGDAHALQSHVDLVQRALADQRMDIADMDALRLALAAVIEAVGAAEPN